MAANVYQQPYRRPPPRKVTPPPANPMGWQNGGQALPPTPGAARPNTGAGGPKQPGLLDVPGYGEEYYTQNKSKFGQPTQASNYWSGIAGKVNGGGRTGDAYNRFTGVVGGERPGSDAARRASGYFEGGPQQGEAWMRANGGQFSAPGVAEGNYDNARRTLGGINYGGQAIDYTRQGLQGAQNTGGYFSGTIDPFSKGQTVVDQEYGYFMPGLREKSYSENMMDSGTGGLIDPYARAQEKQTRAIRDASAARGQFNSERSLRLEQELGADIAASEAQDRIALAGQADEARLGRTGAALDFAQTSEEAAWNRRNLGLTGAKAADESARENIGSMRDSLMFGSDEALAKVDAETNAAEIAQQQMIDRLMSGAEFHDTADRGERDRRKLSVDMGRQADLDRERVEKALLEAAGYADDKDLDWWERGQGMAGAADESDRVRTKDEFDMSVQAQKLMEGRERGGLDDIRGAAEAQIRTLMAGLDRAQQEYFQGELDALQSQVQSGAITQQQADQSREEMLTALANYARTRQTNPSAPPPKKNPLTGYWE